MAHYKNKKEANEALVLMLVGLFFAAGAIAAGIKGAPPAAPRVTTP